MTTAARPSARRDAQEGQEDVTDAAGHHTPRQPGASTARLCRLRQLSRATARLCYNYLDRDHITQSSLCRLITEVSNVHSQCSLICRISGLSTAQRGRVWRRCRRRCSPPPTATPTTATDSGTPTPPRRQHPRGGMRHSRARRTEAGRGETALAD